MTPYASLYAGLAVGLSVAVPIGPMGLLCIQRTLRYGMRVGVCTGLGAATVNVLYGGLVLFGLQAVAPLLAGGGRLLGFAGGLFLLWSAARVLRRRSPAAPDAAACSPLAAYGSAVAFNAANPLSPVLILALLTPLPGLPGPAPLLAGMFTAATSWWVCLSAGVALLRGRLSPRLLELVNRMAAAVLTFYGTLALYRSLSM